MTKAELTARLAAAAEVNQLNIDGWCYYYAMLTGTPCPAPEAFGAGDRSVMYTVDSFAAIAASGFNGGAATVEPGGATGAVTVPVVTGTGPIAGGSTVPVTQTIAPDETSSLSRFLPIAVIAVFGYVIWKKGK